nr:hypothetical protein [Tanacetum cinerariifolium]
ASAEDGIKDPADQGHAECGADLQGRAGDAGDHPGIGRRHAAGDHFHQCRQREALSEADEEEQDGKRHGCRRHAVRRRGDQPCQAEEAGNLQP